MHCTGLLVMALVTSAGAAGCLKYTRPVAPQAAETIEQRHFEAVWTATQDVLRKYQFTIERRDRRAGLITTEPLTGMQFFEFWRKDAVTAYDLWDGSLKTIHRTVTVRIEPVGPEGGEFRPVVDVVVSQPGRPPWEVHSIGAAYNMFVLPGGDEDEDRHAILGYLFERPDRQPDPNAADHPIAMDEALARRLTDEITALAAKRLSTGK